MPRLKTSSIGSSTITIENSASTTTTLAKSSSSLSMSFSNHHHHSNVSGGGRPPAAPRSGSFASIPQAPASYGALLNGASRAATLSMRRTVSSSSDATLPLSNDSSNSTATSGSSGNPIVTRRVRAAESGRNDVLPHSIAPPPMPQPSPPAPRSRSLSSSRSSDLSAPPSPDNTSSSSSTTIPSGSAVVVGGSSNGGSSSGGSLRRRRESAATTTSSTSSNHTSSLSPSPSSGNHTPLLAHPSLGVSRSQRKSSNSNNKNTVSLGNMLQALVVFLIFYLVYDAHYKVQQAQARLEQYRQEETMLVSQMDRIEGRAQQLQDQLRKLKEDQLNTVTAATTSAATAASASAGKSKNNSNNNNNNNNDNGNTVPNHPPPKNNMNKKKKMAQPSKDAQRTAESILQQMKNVQRESQVVESEVHTLESFLQEAARKEIAERYGDGSTIHVTMDMRMREESQPSQIIFELFVKDTPHAAWVLLQQIQAHNWERAHWMRHPNHMLIADPAKTATKVLDFVERPALLEDGTPSASTHKAWTIGLKPAHGGQAYSLFINLMDNSKRHKDYVCLGKIINGFDTLQELMHIPTNVQQDFRMSSMVEIKDMMVSTTANGSN